MSESSGVFRPPFTLPRSTQLGTIATLTVSAAVSPTSFPPWKFSFITISDIFRPEFILPKSTQIHILSTLTRAAAFPFPLQPSASLALLDIFRPEFILPPKPIQSIFPIIAMAPDNIFPIIWRRRRR